MKLAILLVFAGCDWSLHRMQEQPRCTVHGATDLLPYASCNLLPPDGIVAMELPREPPALSRALVQRGRDRYDRICGACHGLAGDGRSQVARAMTIRRPPSLVDPVAARLSDARILTVIERGYGLMPSYRMLVAPDDRFAILHYLRALQQRDVRLVDLAPGLQAEAGRWLH